MKLEQAIFTSARSQRVAGYHLVNQSQGISDGTAQILSRWSPSHDSLIQSGRNASSVNFFKIADGHYAVSRTVLGAPEYSGRGGLQTVTFLILVSAEQLKPYGNDPIALVNMAMRNGNMCFVDGAFSNQPIEIPDAHVTLGNLPNQLKYEPILDEVIELMAHGNQVAIVGAKQPLKTMQSLIHRLPVEHRIGFSFTTGLKPSSQRPFTIHIAQTADIDTRAYFSRKAIRMVNFESTTVGAGNAIY